MTGWIIALALVAVIGGLAWIRLAPSDPGRWHVDLAAPGFVAPGNAHVFCVQPDNRYGPIVGDPADLLARLDAVALATPRTTRLAGSAAEGRITWVTRSAVMGFPDYTTAQIMAGPGVCVMGRQRIGSQDWGVNAARVGSWMQEVLGLPERPDMTGF